MRRLSVLLVLTAAPWLSAGPARAADRTPPDFKPDPLSVQRYGPAYRYPQAGWIVLHIEGEPYERGVQHGRLLAPEIAANVRCFAATQCPKDPASGWKHIRTLVDSLFQRRYDKEYLEEMKGIADGAAAAGAKFDGRAIDLLDVVAVNSWPEIDTLDSALDATPTGLEPLKFPEDKPKPPAEPKPMRCSAFAAVGPATADGKIVFGHITMYHLYPSSFYNIWLDVKPAKGHRVLMQSYPAGIQSGLDYYMNDAGILVSETTLAQTRFDINGMAVASRIRQALQYADSIDQVVEILKKDNNGLYTNEWMIADTKTNEIAMFELGTHKSRLYRSKNNDWYGGTEGFYWGCNNTKDLEVRLETIPSTEGKPESAVFRPADRDKKWLDLYDKYKGKIDADFGKLAFTTPPLAAYHSVDAKFTTTEMAKDLKTWALFGPPLGRTWQPTEDEKRDYPEVRPMASNPWAVLTARAPAAADPKALAAVDLHNPASSKNDLAAYRDKGKRRRDGEEVEQDDATPSGPAWHGTLLPKGDADVWLAEAFAGYEQAVTRDKVMCLRCGDNPAAPERADLGLALFAWRADYNLGARAHAEATLKDTKADLRQSDWHRVASGKGVLLLHDLRSRLGAEAFDDLMDRFGRAHAGKPTSAEEFRAFVLEAKPKGVGPDFFDSWLLKPGLPQLALGQVSVRRAGKGYEVKATLSARKTWPSAPVEVTVETKAGDVTKTVSVEGDATTFTIDTDDAPRRLVVDKNNRTAKANGGAFSVLTFFEEIEDTLIVCGTGDEVNANREAAESLQQAIRARWCNVTVPIKTDKEATDDDLKTHHVVLIGRPDCNAVVAKYRDQLPITFGDRSFTANGEAYAHMDSAVLAATENLLNPRYSMVVVAGLSSAATLRAAPLLAANDRRAAEVVVLPHGKDAKSLVAPAKDLVRDLPEPAEGGKTGP
jgi:hypothetical protein